MRLDSFAVAASMTLVLMACPAIVINPAAETDATADGTASETTPAQDVANDGPTDVANDGPTDVANDGPTDVANDGPGDTQEDSVLDTPEDAVLDTTPDIVACMDTTCAAAHRGPCDGNVCGPCLSGFQDEAGDCVDTDECLLAATCGDNATCTNEVGSFKCACNVGFEGDGQSCTEIDECAAAPCLNGGTCVDGLAEFTCVCEAPWTGDTCEIGPPGEVCESAIPVALSATEPTVIQVAGTVGQDDYTASDQCPGFANVGPTPGGDVVYQLTVATTADYTFGRASEFGPDLVYLVTDCADIAGSCVGMYDILAQDLIVDTFTLVAGQTYFMIVDYWSADQDPPGALELTIAVAFDECAAGTDTCSSDPNATCTDLLVGFECVCPAGFQWSGSACLPNA